MPLMSLTEVDYELIASVNRELQLYIDNLEHIRYHLAAIVDIL